MKRRWKQGTQKKTEISFCVTAAANRNFGRSSFRTVIVAFFWILVWQGLSLSVSQIAPERGWLVPSPFLTFQRLTELSMEATFYRSVSATLLRVVLGSFYSFIAGTLLALCSYGNLWIRSLTEGLMAVLKSTPVMAVAIYAILFLKSGNVPVFVCFLICCPVVYANLLQGLEHMDRKLLEMAAVFGIRFRDRIRKLYLPSLKPQIKAAVSLVSGLSWKTVVAGEVLSIPQHSMGYSLLASKMYFDIPSLFAWVIAIVALSILFEKLIAAALRRL